jgi:hypothetical protein
MRKAALVTFTAITVITFLLVLPYVWGGFEWSTTELAILYGVGFVILIGYLWLIPAQQGKGQKKKKASDIGQSNTVTSIACYGSDFLEEREFKAGDYINKQVGKCLKCGRELYIKSIYDVKKNERR